MRRRLLPVFAITSVLVGVTGASGQEPLVTVPQGALVAPDTTPSSRFGAAVAADGDTLVVGVPGDGTAGDAAGAAFVFERSGTAWAHQATLTAPDLAAGDRFGYSVALAGDTALVGAPFDDTSGFSDAGSVHVFSRSDGIWAHRTTLADPDPRQADGFGYSVALAGDTAVVGTPFDNEPGTEEDIGAAYDAGAAMVFSRSGDVWGHEATLRPPDNLRGSFGWTVAVADETIAVGRPNANSGFTTGFDSGAVFMFARSGTAWAHQETLTPPEPATGDRFGATVAVAGDTVVVGVPGHDTVAGTDAGSAQVFTRTGTAWNYHLTLVPPDAAPGDALGSAVAISGDTVVAGAPAADSDAGVSVGSAHVFGRSGTVWSHLGPLANIDGAADDAFGSAVAVSGETAVAGVPRDDNVSGTDAGSVSVQTRSATTWGLQALLTPPDAGPDDAFALAVAVEGDTAMIGAPFDDTPAGAAAGAVHLFRRTGTAWTNQGTLTAADAAPGDGFGGAVAFAGDTAVVSAVYDDTSAGTDTGSASVFTRSGTGWVHQALLVPPDVSPGDIAGTALALTGDTVVVGVPYDDTAAGANTGSVAVYTRIGTGWVHQATLTAPDAGPDDGFGWSVAAAGDTVVVGAPRHLGGSAYVFTRSGGVWSHTATLSAPGTGPGDYFGGSVAIAGDTALVGAALDEPSGEDDSGSVSVFTRSGGTWAHQVTLAPAGSEDDGLFGLSVDLDGDTAVVGAPCNRIGTAWVFVRKGADWSLEAPFFPSRSASTIDCYLYGSPVAISGRTIVVGAPADGHRVGSAGVALVDQAPVAAGDVYDTGEDTVLALPAAAGVLANDGDAEGDPLTAQVVAPPPGTLDLQPDGSFTYTPEPDDAGTVTFSYRAHDGYTDSAPVDVTINIAAANDPPVALDDAAGTNVNRPVDVVVTGNDTDADPEDPGQLTAVVEDAPGAGTATCSGASCTYVPDPGFTGTVTFTYRAVDPAGARSEPATVTVTVASAGTPAAADDVIVTPEDTPAELDVTANDALGDEPATASLTDGPAGGEAACAGATCTYTPAADFSGDDRFTYTLRDADGQTATATVTVKVSAVNDPPRLAPPAPLAIELGGTIPALTAADADGDLLAFSVAGGALPPGVRLNPDGTFTGAATVPGDTTATVQACDPDRACAASELRVEVQGPGVDGTDRPDPRPEDLLRPLRLPEAGAPRLPEAGTLPRTGGPLPLGALGGALAASGLAAFAGSRTLRRRPPPERRPDRRPVRDG